MVEGDVCGEGVGELFGIHGDDDDGDDDGDGGGGSSGVRCWRR